jgi:predicted O-methyltransferase YrrM
MTNSLLDKIFLELSVTDKDGNSYPVHSHTSPEQCRFLQSIIEKIKPSATLEIGLAYGISSLAILQALDVLGKPFNHILIDPFQSDWKDIGLLNIEKAGFTKNTSFYRELSDQVLPRLLQEGRSIQFAYIDSTKVFDVLMVDAYFINKLLDVNGVLVLDDCTFPGIRLLARFLAVHPCFRVYDAITKDKPSAKKRFLRSFNHFIIGLLPFKKRIFPNINFTKDETLGVNYHCIAFQKIKEDDRYWDWYKTF